MKVGPGHGNAASCQDLTLWFPPQGCYEKVKLWFDDNKHVLGTVGMCILIMQVRRHRHPNWTDESPSWGSVVFTQPSPAQQ